MANGTFDKRDPATEGHFIVTPIGSDGKEYWESRMCPDWVVEGREYFAKWCAQEQLKCRYGEVEIITCVVTEYADATFEKIVNTALYTAAYFERFPMARPERY
jgi:hypothetical protein